MKNNVLHTKDVAIIGAGPVGLTTARLLQQEGVNVHVYEWDAHANIRVFGGTLDIHKSTGQKALKKAGLIEAFYTAARPTGERLTDTSGKLLMQEFPSVDHLYDRPEIDRNDLRQLLLKSLKANTVIWDKQLIEVTKKAEQFILHFADGTEVLTDVVIGANGGKSLVRNLLTDAQPKFTGTFIIQGEVTTPEIKSPGFKQLCAEDNLMVMGDGRMFFSQVKAQGTINYFLCFQAGPYFVADEQLDVNNANQIRAYLKKTCTTWDAAFIELFDATESFWVLPMRNMPLDKKWHTDDAVTLIGDAAHLMPPFAGVGVNIGLLDALYLSEHLTNGKHTTIREAMEAYETQMFEYAREAQQETAASEAGFFSDRPLEEMLKGREEWNKTL